MTPVNFTQANTIFKAPAELHENQVRPIVAYSGPIPGGSLDGETMIVVAWKPNDGELRALNNGAPVFLTMIGSLPPHFLTTDFENATSPA